MTGKARPLTREVEIGGRRLGYGILPGSGPPLLLVHGAAARWQVYRPLMLALQAGYHQYAPDLRGHGVSDRAPDYGIDGFASDIIDFADKVVGAPVHLFGHSLGGWIALTVAARRADLVRSLVIADSGIYPDDIPHEVRTAWLAGLPLALRSLATSLHQFDTEVLNQYHDRRMTRDYHPDELLARVRCPTLLIQADPACGGFMSDNDVRRATQLLADVRHIRLDGVGHGLHIEDSARVADTFREFHRPNQSIRS
ncbi:alpha/beta fold hydrolase [Micromonospora sp. NPDC049204]|uniref:alpha/beta fold hydrolase n=1 Tax=Micromonospora sp. NPDC049204 TaxID=3154351 RepID=UPI0034095BC6